MTIGRRLLVGGLLLLVTLKASVAIEDSTEIANTLSDFERENDLIEHNPDYIEGGSGDEGSEESADGEVEEERGKIKRALSKSGKEAAKSWMMIRNHRTSITIALAVFAFRREIWSFVSPMVTETTQDGSKSVKRIRISPTSILKLVLFIDAMRKIQSTSQRAASPATRDSVSGSLLGRILHDLLHPTNIAYIPPVEQHYTFEKINDRYVKDSMAYKKIFAQQGTSTSPLFPIFGKKLISGAVGNNNSSSPPRLMSMGIIGGTEGGNTCYNSTSVILDLKSLDATLSQMEGLRDEVSFLLYQHRANMESQKKANPANHTEAAPLSELEVIIFLESPGGSASDYGLAAEQIGRLRNEPGIVVTVCVDKVAASGGYMMACMATPGRLFAAPFALLGSIGVIGQAINIHSVLQNWGVKPLVFRGGKDKAPVGLVGEVTKEGMAKVQDMVDKTHSAFKRYVITARPILLDTIDHVATGDIWLGYDALAAGLVDRIVTSDEYISERIREGARVLKLLKFHRPRFPFGNTISSPRRLIQSYTGFSFGDVFRDLKRVLSKMAEVLDDVQGKNEDTCHVVAARMLGMQHATTANSII